MMESSVHPSIRLSLAALFALVLGAPAPTPLGQSNTWLTTAPAKMAHPGTGGTGHPTTALFAEEAQVTVNPIPPRGAAPALKDIIGDHVDLFFAPRQWVLQGVTAGQM